VNLVDAPSEAPEDREMLSPYCAFVGPEDVRLFVGKHRGQPVFVPVGRLPSVE
jgi:hypothetical protein